MAREVKQWITINGHHVPVYEGQTTDDAAKGFMEHAKKAKNSKAKKEIKMPDHEDEKLASAKRTLSNSQSNLEALKKSLKNHANDSHTKEIQDKIKEAEKEVNTNAKRVNFLESSKKVDDAQKKEDLERYARKEAERKRMQDEEDDYFNFLEEQEKEHQIRNKREAAEKKAKEKAEREEWEKEEKRLSALEKKSSSKKSSLYGKGLSELREDKEARRLIDNIEEAEDEIRGRGIDPNDDSEFWVRAKQADMKELKDKYGYDWEPDTASKSLDESKASMISNTEKRLKQAEQYLKKDPDNKALQSRVEKHKKELEELKSWDTKSKPDTSKEVLKVRDSLDSGKSAVTTSKEVADMYAANKNPNAKFKVEKQKDGSYKISKASQEDGSSDKPDTFGRMATRLANKGIKSEEDIADYLRGLSATRRSNLARQMGITSRGEDKVKEMANKIANSANKTEQVSKAIKSKANKDTPSMHKLSNAKHVQNKVNDLNDLHDMAWKSGADKDAIKTRIRQAADQLPDETVLARVTEDSSITHTSKGMVSETNTKVSKLYKIDGKWSRYKDGSGKINDIASEVIHSSGKLQTLEAAEKEARKRSQNDSIKTKRYGIKEKWER